MTVIAIYVFRLIMKFQIWNCYNMNLEKHINFKQIEKNL